MLKNPSVDLSVIVPCYNEEANLDYLFERLITVLDKLGLTYEIICVNDGSKDDTLAHLIQYHHLYDVIKVINFSRNFGKEIALTAGLDYAQGKAIVPIDADLQDPPELIEALIEKWQQGYDVVYATRRSRKGETWFKRFTANAFYRTVDKISKVPIPQNTGDFRLLDRKVVDALKQIPERTRFMKGLFAWVGFKQTSVLFDREKDLKAKLTGIIGGYGILLLMALLLFSLRPLKVWSYIGLLISIISLFYAGFLLIRTLVLGIDVPGYASLMVAILFLGGIQLISLGVIGEYLGRVYEEVKQRPLYLVRDCYGLTKKGNSSEKVEKMEKFN